MIILLYVLNLQVSKKYSCWNEINSILNETYFLRTFTISIEAYTFYYSKKLSLFLFDNSQKRNNTKALKYTGFMRGKKVVFIRLFYCLFGQISWIG